MNNSGQLTPGTIGQKTDPAVTYSLGDAIQFALPDANGELHWFDGTIHGIRDYEESETTEPMRSYLIDTGRDERVDEFKFDKRNDEFNSRVNAILDDESNPIVDAVEASDVVSTHEDLPESEVYTEVVRQPEQIELPATEIRMPEAVKIEAR